MIVRSIVYYIFAAHYKRIVVLSAAEKFQQAQHGTWGKNTNVKAIDN